MHIFKRYSIQIDFRNYRVESICREFESFYIRLSLQDKQRDEKRQIRLNKEEETRQKKEMKNRNKTVKNEDHIETKEDVVKLTPGWLSYNLLW